MTFDEKILSYDMTAHDKLLAKIAETIIEAYNGSYKPHLFDWIAFCNNENYYSVKHTNEGYSLIFTQTERRNPPHKRCVTTDASIDEFIEHTFLTLTGNPSVKWKDVEQSKAVLIALKKMFDIEISLTLNPSDNGYFSYPNIFAAWKGSGNMHEEMKEKGFSYFDRNLWEIRL